jgi:hypothetical protein
VAVKRVICPERVRKIPAHFSWVDRRLARDRHNRRYKQAAALYPFVVMVVDAQGLNYYSAILLGKTLSMHPRRLRHARSDLIHVALGAYQRPLYQVLALDSPPPRRELAMDEARARLSQLCQALGKRHGQL